MSDTTTHDAGQTRSRKKMYKNCDRCRQAKRACSAQYVSIAEALASKVACTNCQKKGQVCTFNSLINSFGGIPLGGLTGAAFAESLQQEAAHQSALQQGDDTLAMMDAEPGTGGKRRRDSEDAMNSVNAAFEVLNGNAARRGSEGDEEQQSKRQRLTAGEEAGETFASFADFEQQTQHNALVVSRTQTPLPSSFEDDLFSTSGGPSLFDMLGFDIWGTAPNVRLSASADRLHLNTDLLNVYEGAAESAFRVWVTDATTPYLLGSPAAHGTGSAGAAGMALNKKVCLLDHASKRIFKPDDANRNVEKRVSEAYHAVLLAYAAQWPRHRSASGSRAEWRPDEARIRLSLWKQARDKLMDAADAWSFRIVFALILFAWTEKPREVPDGHAWDPATDVPPSIHVPSLDENSALDSSSWQIPAEASTMMLATAMRKLKAFRLKIQQLRRKGIDLWSTEQRGLDESQVAHRQAEATLLENTYHNLYWFGCMMDTELSVLRKYDAVIGDEDSDLTDQLLSPHRATLLHPPPDSFASAAGATKPLRKIWDEVIPANSQQHRHTFARSWPCSEEDAKRTLAYATPIKVLLFRHVGRLQSSYWRQASSEQIERQINHVLSVVRHWDETFAPFFASCIAHHAELPPSLQSWHVITATKWNLAAILLVELVQTMDRSAADPFANTDASFAALRSQVCNQTAALIHAIQNSSLSPSTTAPPAAAGGGGGGGGGSGGGGEGMGAFGFIESTGSTILHSDPWPEISVHGFACVAKSEIKHFATLVEAARWDEVRCAEHRVEKCIWALEQLSNRSTMAVDAAKEVRALLEMHSPFKQQKVEALGAFLTGQDAVPTATTVPAAPAPAPAAVPGAGVGVLTDEVWQSCLKILNESQGDAHPLPNEGFAGSTEAANGAAAQLWHLDMMPSSSASSASTSSAVMAADDLSTSQLAADPFFLDMSDTTSSRASSNHSLSPPLTTATLASLDYASTTPISPPTVAPAQAAKDVPLEYGLNLEAFQLRV